MTWVNFPAGDYNWDSGTSFNVKYLISNNKSKNIASLFNDKKIDSKSEVLKLMDDLNNKIQIKGEKINEINNDGYYITDIGGNYFISRTNILSKYPWNDNLKTVEHSYFLLILWCNNIKILYDKNFIFHQMKGEYRIYDKNGQSLRQSRKFVDIF